MIRALFASLLLTSAVSHAGDTWTNQFVGVQMLHRTTVSPAQDIHVLKIDLSTPGLKLRATKSSERRQTTSSFGKAVGAQAAINGDFFLYTDYSVRGLAIGEGQLWPNSVDTMMRGNIIFDATLSRVDLNVLQRVTPYDSTWMYGSVGGWPTVLKNGVIIDAAAVGLHCTARNPRTAIGRSLDKQTLYLVVVDGRSTTSVGMTCNELGTLMANLGADDALSLDGGGSTTMWVGGLGVVNTPSDGAERVVGNHLALFAPKLGSTGTVSGVVTEAGNPTKVLAGATIKLGTLATDTTDAQGQYQFDVPAAAYTVTASKIGYVTQTVNRTVVAGQTKTANFAMVPNPATTDTDGDGIFDPVDNCPAVANPGQRDIDGDGLGDACDPDNDNDNVPDEDDNCPNLANPDQADNDLDGKGDPCDADDDNDTVLDTVDNCPLDANPDQADADHDGVGDVCDPSFADGGVTPDAGVTADGGPGQPDAGQLEPDAGNVEPDAGAIEPDAGTQQPDAGHLPADAGPGSIADGGDQLDPPTAAGCGCSSGTGLLPLGLICLLARRRRLAVAHASHRV